MYIQVVITILHWNIKGLTFNVQNTHRVEATMQKLRKSIVSHVKKAPSVGVSYMEGIICYHIAPGPLYGTCGYGTDRGKSLN